MNGALTSAINGGMGVLYFWHSHDALNVPDHNPHYQACHIYTYTQQKSPFFRILHLVKSK